ncbi:TRAP transporter large permease [Xanthobacteraceae bacterium Astr-EGSB]|uniref:TRAP transporter large permease n=1 Tax=Astrobacterium formosum TaxID=3069710 RepID=UPI0027B70F6C|nr:TRAP transporter large permease [Xanthobacteraceae bacterium Astr-EGSB]
MSMLVLFLGFCVLSLAGVPIYAGLGLASILYLLVSNPDFIVMLPQRVWSGLDSYMMIALPLFILAGELMNRGGITQRIIDFSLHVVRPIKGGLGEVCVVASMVFGGISGSSVADASAIGSVMIPAMEKKGFSKRYATGLVVAASTMGMIIPPSIPMVTYSMVSGASIGDLFMAGLVPGVMIGLFQLVALFFYKRTNKLHLLEQAIEHRHGFWKTGREGLLALIMPLLIIGTISFGVATASESASIAVLYSLIIGFFVFKELRLKDLPEVLEKTFITSSSVMIIIGFSMIFGWVMAMEKVPNTIAMFFMTMEVSRFWVLMILVVFILFIGTFLDVTPALLLVTPIMIPVLRHYGIDEVQFGAIMIVGTAVGLVSPPLGMCLNAGNKISGLPIWDIFTAALPFLICDVIVLLLVTYVPEVSLTVPRLLGGH